MRILILIVQYHPLLNPNVFRWSAIAEHWAGQGHEVHVLCSWLRGRPADEKINGVWVHRVGHATLLDLAYNFVGIEKRRGESREANDIWRPSFGRRLLERIVDYTWRTFYWPDGSCIWYYPALRKAQRLIDQYGIEGIITVSYPFSVHLIGLACKRQFSVIRWLADSEDPFSIMEMQPQNNFSLYRRLNHWAEAKVFQMANRLTVTVDATQRAYLDAFGPLHHMSVVPPLFDNLSWERSLEVNWKPKAGFLHIGYFGAFYINIREPDKILDLLEAAVQNLQCLDKKIRVHFFGEIGTNFIPTFARYQSLQEIICFHGLLPKVMALGAMRQMDVLLNIGNKSAIQLPSKCVDYLATGKPILNLHHGSADTFKEFFANYPKIRNIDVTAVESERIFCDYLSDLLSAMDKDTDLSIEELQNWLQPYTIKVISDRFLELLKQPTIEKNGETSP